jgi:hypothetical protein
MASKPDTVGYDTAAAARIETLQNELARLEGELGRYAEAIADARPLATIFRSRFRQLLRQVPRQT